MNVHDRLSVCVDCIMFIANGDLPEDRPDLVELIELYIGSENVKHLCAGGAESDENEFSWAPCQCCGSKLGGARHAATVLCDHDYCKEEKEGE